MNRRWATMRKGIARLGNPFATFGNHTSGELGQKLRVGGEEFVRHRVDLIQRQQRTGQRIQRDRVVDMVLVPG